MPRSCALGALHHRQCPHALVLVQFDFPVWLQTKGESGKVDHASLYVVLARVLGGVLGFHRYASITDMSLQESTQSQDKEQATRLQKQERVRGLALPKQQQTRDQRARQALLQATKENPEIAASCKISLLEIASGIRRLDKSSNKGYRNNKPDKPKNHCDGYVVSCQGYKIGWTKSPRCESYDYRCLIFVLDTIRDCSRSFSLISSHASFFLSSRTCSGVLDFGTGYQYFK